MNDKVKSTIIYIISAVIALMMSVYIAIQLISGFSTGIETTPAILVTERELETLNAYIIREEKVITTTAKGSVNYLFSNGTKVGVGSSVARIYCGEDSVTQELVNIDKKISALENSGISDDLVIADTATLDARITELYTAISSKTASGNIQYAMNEKNNLLALLNRREIMIGNTDGYASAIELLNQQREELLTQLSSEPIEITVDCSGYFYDSIDGYEEAYSDADITTMTISGFRKLISSEKKDDNYYYGQYVIGKICNGYSWYVACEIPYDDAHNYVVGKTYTIIYPYSGDKELQATLYRAITEPNSDRCILIFKNGTVLSDFSFLRNQTIEVISSTYTGYRVPISAVKIVDGVRGVYVLSGGRVYFREINPIFEKNGYLLVEEKDSKDSSQSNRLSINEYIITDNGDYYDGMLIE